MYEADDPSHDSITCAVCEENVPRAHSILRASLGRVCWFCHTDASAFDDDDDDDDWDDDDWYGDWDD